jgi:hypothetical protein
MGDIWFNMQKDNNNKTGGKNALLSLFYLIGRFSWRFINDGDLIFKVFFLLNKLTFNVSI